MEGLGEGRERVSASPGRGVRSRVSSKPPQKSALCSRSHLGLPSAEPGRRGGGARREAGLGRRPGTARRPRAEAGGRPDLCFSWRHSAPDPVGLKFGMWPGQQLCFVLALSLRVSRAGGRADAAAQRWREASALRCSQPGWQRSDLGTISPCCVRRTSPGQDPRHYCWFVVP